MSEAASASAPKLVRWAFNMANGSTSVPETTKTESGAGTYVPSTITFLSSQLVAHGFARPPGIVEPLARLGADDQDAVVRCLRSLLEQRVTDMERLDELSSRLRTLSLDHERLLGFHKTSKEQVFQAQQETEVVKSKHATTTAQLNDLQSSHKQVMTNLQRAQSALVFARQTAQNELKRKDKEIERIQERWSKLSSEQSKSSAGPSLRCANLIASATTGDTPVPKGENVLESSLARLKTDYDRISLQNESFRVMLVSFATSLDRLVRRSNPFHAKSHCKELSESTLFPPSAKPWKDDAENARVALQTLMLAAEVGMQDRLLDVLEDGGEAAQAKEEAARREKELKETLLQEIETLKFELDESRKALTDQMNGALDAFALDQHLLRSQSRPSIGESSASATAAQQAEHQERERLMEEEREKLAASAIQLGKERNALAAARLELQEEKRAWKLQQMLEDMPDTPVANNSSNRNPTIAAPVFVEPQPHSNRPRRSRSPKKASSPTMRLSPTKRSPRKLLTTYASSSGLLKPPSFDDVDEDDEEDDLGATMFRQRSHEFLRGPLSRASLGGVIGGPRLSDESIVEDAPVNPFDQILFQSAQAAESLSKLNLSPERAKPSTETAPAAENQFEPRVPSQPVVPSQMATKQDNESGPAESSGPSAPRTPISLSAATARLKKNPYAPVVPSPLSRILRMADSPPSPRNDGPAAAKGPSALATLPPAQVSMAPSRWTLGQLDEGDEEEEASGSSGSVAVPTLTLADELGLDAGELETFGSKPRASPDKRPVGRHRATSPRKNKETGKGKLLGHPRIAASSGMASGSLRGGRVEKENAFPPVVSSQSLAARTVFGAASASGGSTTGALGGGPVSKKITIGHRVVGGRPTTSSPHISRPGASQSRLLSNASGKAAGAVRGSLRAHMHARFGGTTMPIGD